MMRTTVTWQPAIADETGTPLVANAPTITHPARRRLVRHVGFVCLTGIIAGCTSPGRRGGITRYAPALYQVIPPSGYRGQAWLIGAVHGSGANLQPLPRTIKDALDASSELAIELDAQGRRQQLLDAFSVRTRLPAGEMLDNLLPRRSIDWLKHRFELSEAQWRTIARLQPWSLTQLLRGQSQLAIPTRYPGLETVLIHRARQRGLPLTELETAAEQVQALAGGTLAEQVELLRKRIGDQNFWDNRVEPVIQAWRSGNETELNFLKERTFGSLSERQQSPALAQLHERLFDVRDRRMAQRLLDRLRQPRQVFTVVGAFHLVGQTNLIEQLQRLGARVTRHTIQTH